MTRKGSPKPIGQDDRTRAGPRSGLRRSSRGLRSSARGSRPTTTPRPSCGWACTRSTCPSAASPGRRPCVEALCWGWIDSVAQRIDEDAVRQRWTPRKATQQLEHGQHHRRRAAHRRGPDAAAAAWPPTSGAAPTAPASTPTRTATSSCAAEYAAQLAADPRASRLLGGRHRRPTARSPCNWVLTAKQEATRDKRMTQLVEDSAAGRLIPQPALRQPAQVGGAGGSGGRGGAPRAAVASSPRGHTPRPTGSAGSRRTPRTKRADRDDFARDRARLVHSASLRRLSAKTQVVQPGDDDFVRNRLTHSPRGGPDRPRVRRRPSAAAPTSSTPPAWPTTSATRRSATTASSALDEVAADIGGFEGNAQTLRLLTRLEPKRVHPDGRPAGLNLTRASLDAATKYPWAAAAPAAIAPHGEVRRLRRRPAGLRLVPGRRRAGRSAASRPTSWTGPTTSPTPCTTSRTPSPPGRLDVRRLRDAIDVDAVLAVATGLYAADLGVRRPRRRAGTRPRQRRRAHGIRRLAASTAPPSRT